MKLAGCGRPNQAEDAGAASLNQAALLFLRGQGHGFHQLDKFPIGRDTQKVLRILIPGLGEQHGILCRGRLDVVQVVIQQEVDVQQVFAGAEHDVSGIQLREDAQ